MNPREQCTLLLFGQIVKSAFRVSPLDPVFPPPSSAVRYSGFLSVLIAGAPESPPRSRGHDLIQEKNWALGGPGRPRRLWLRDGTMRWRSRSFTLGLRHPHLWHLPINRQLPFPIHAPLRLPSSLLSYAPPPDCLSRIVGPLPSPLQDSLCRHSFSVSSFNDVLTHRSRATSVLDGCSNSDGGTAGHQGRSGRGLPVGPEARLAEYHQGRLSEKVLG